MYNRRNMNAVVVCLEGAEDSRNGLGNQGSQLP